MSKERKTRNAVSILHRTYVKDDPDRKAELAAERVNAEVAEMIRDLRNQARLSQKELADLVGTTQSVISRLEDNDYEGHSLSMLNRVARALNQRVTVIMTAADPDSGTLRYTFRLVLENLRRNKGWTVDDLSRKTGIDRNEILTMERVDGYRPSPLTLHKLSNTYHVPESCLAALAGAFDEIPESVRESASQFAAQSESFSKLTKEQKRCLDEFVKSLRMATG